MLHPRVIPSLLFMNNGLIKTKKFSNPVYLGDPINIVKIFNDKEVDEIIFLDIYATKEKRKPNYELIKMIANECFIPFGFGGGIKSFEDANRILQLGVEKVIINTAAIINPPLIKELADAFGSQSVVVSIDIKTNGVLEEVRINNGKKSTGINPLMHAKYAEKLGAGEIFLNYIDRDGMMNGYNIESIKRITAALTVPVIACGGAGKLQDIHDVIKIGGASAASAGSMFVFHGQLHGILINYPSQEELVNLFSN